MVYGVSLSSSFLFKLLISASPGNPKHLNVAREELEEAYAKAQEKARLEVRTRSQPELRILVAQGNEGTHTYDGIDVCAGRVANEIDREVKRIEKDGSKVVHDFSVMGYSVGGREFEDLSLKRTTTNLLAF